MNPVRRWFRVVAGKDEAPVSDEAKAALAASTERAEDAARRADDMARVVAPLREANSRNHFEQSIRAVFQGRPA